MSDNDRLPGAERPIRIGAFPADSNPWRIDWFGPIAFPDRAVRRRQPSVLVRMSRVEPFAFAFPGMLKHASATTGYTNRWVSVGTAKLLKIGDVWRNQTLEAEPEYDTEVFSDIDVNRSTTEVVKAGLRFEDESYLLPMAQHPWHAGNTQSYCVRVNTTLGHDIVIPCMELARHYFGSSAELLARLFLPPLLKDRLYEYKYFKQETGALFMQLADGMPGQSAEDVARIALCSEAWRAANMIGDSCLRASVGGRDVYPKMTFPFEGRTTLQVRGIWLSRGLQAKGTFLVFQILSCWHPFPFQTLRYRTKGQTRKFMPPSGSPLDEQRRKGLPPPKEPRLVEQDASASLGGVSLSVRSRRRFPDLESKLVWMAKPLRTEAMIPSRKREGDEISDVSVGESDGSNLVRPVSLVDEGRRGWVIPPFLDGLHRAMRMLSGHEVTLLSASTEDGWTLPITILADNDGVIDDSLLVREGAESRPRRVCVFMVEGFECLGVVVAVEDEPMPLKWYPVGTDDVKDPWQVLVLAANDFVHGRQHPSGKDLLISKTDEVPILPRLVQWLSDCVAVGDGCCVRP